ncbi:MAG: N-acetylmuramoyl-L-alanine amidase [Desulfotignum sp.]|nr:N-acetylmuramoyl-L-alanine amidase [Desulfotignum sp.]MCF8126367.1 N-acetylmuramoyl-L-alanine amidase [Desulfotignum sp.]
MAAFICFFMLWAGFIETGTASVPKQKYLAADACFKTLRNSPVKRQKVSEWLECIRRYEAIYKMYPDSPWAPAGMYSAADLYLQLFALSRDALFKTRAIDLLTRIRNKYPGSAYNARAKTRLSSFLESPDSQTGPVRHIRSKKAETRKKHIPLAKETSREKTDAQQDADFNRQTSSLESQLQPVDTNAPDNGDSDLSLDTQISGTDAQVTDLRFWSNPEYTRIVINASRDRTYSHHLLKKDPDLDIPFQRLYVDIPQSRLGQGVAEHTPINDDLLKQARAGQYLPHTVRVVVDIKSFENYKIFSLKDPFRIVIDVWGDRAGTAQTDQAGAGTGDLVKNSPMTTDNLESSDIARQLALGVRKIVIDPGHGGSDPGAPGYTKGVWEKDIVLQLAKNLAGKLRDRLRCTVLLTRNSDTKLTLEERTAMANTQRADLFISLHTNAARNKNLAGIETYLLNLATDAQAISVAARENATSKKNISDLEFILSDLMKHAKIGESTRLANDVHHAMIQGMTKKYSKITDLGVKQAPFYVLLGARMPSVLIETSFVSNKIECERLLNPAYQDALCSAIADGVQKYVDATNPRQL